MTLPLPRPRHLAVVAVFALLLGMLAIVRPVSAVVVPTGTLGGFENDGNLAAASANDWANVTVTKVIDDTLDTGFQGSSKEEQPANWTCNAGGANPGKGNILRAYLNLHATQNPNTAFLNLGMVRQDGNGDAHVNFEFDKNASTPPANPTSGPCPINRQPGDFLVTYDFSGGSSPAEIRAWTWDGSQWVEKTLQAGDAAAATNSGTTNDTISGGVIVDRGFGEMTLNLLAQGLGDVIGCPAKAAVVNVRSRSSESIDSALQDKLPETSFSLDTCGKVIVHKVDDHVPAHPLAGATFGLFDNANATGAPAQTCTSVADGSCKFDTVTPGNYWVKETGAPSGYSADATIKPVSVGWAQTVDVAQPFVNPRDTGYLKIVKQLKDGSTVVVPPDLHVLDGTSFTVYRDANHNGSLDAGETAKLWPAETNDAACTINGGSGACTTGPLPTGAYRVHETSAPLGTTAGPDVDATVTKGNADHPTTVNYVNAVQPINIGLTKVGNVTAAHIGDTVTYTFTASTGGPRLHDISFVDLLPNGCDAGTTSGPTGDDGDGYLETGEGWVWTCTHSVTANDLPSLLNKAKVTGTDDFGRSVNATAQFTFTVLDPHIAVVKSGPTSAHEGDVVTYSFKVTNTGTTLLHGVAVSDDKLGSVGTIGDLAPGASTTLTKNFTVPAGSAIDNVATACGTDALALQVCDTDTHHLVVMHPNIGIVKSAVSTAHPGDVVTYSFAVTNTGDVALHNVAVTDNVMGPVGTIGNLAAGASTTLTKDFAVPTGNGVDNMATACGADPLQLQVCAHDTHHLTIIHPAIDVVKSAASTAHTGDVIFYTFHVSNTGDVPLHNVAVTDDKFGAVGTVGDLAVGADATLTTAFTVPAGNTYDNTATACGNDPLQLQVCDTSDHHLVIIHPSITVEKTAAATAHESDVITYSFKVTNTSDVALHDVAVTDDVIGPIGTVGDLAAGASTTLTKDFTVPTSSTGVDNVATACGKDPLQLEVCDTDDHHLTVIHPAITVEKTAAATAHEGDVVTYSFKVTNTGDVPLHNVTVDDNVMGAIGSIGNLAVGASTTLTKDYTVPSPRDAVDNTATACGFDPLDLQVCGPDDHHLTVIHPHVHIVKSAVSSAHEGDVIFYTFTVTNSGDVPLHNVAVTDNVMGAIGTVGDLAVGASTTLTKEFTVPVGNAVDNTGTVCGNDPLQLQVCGTDDHHLTIIHPAITVEKTAVATAHEGDVVTYSFKVTNTGDVALSGVAVTDNVMGAIGTIDELALGASTTLTKNFTVPAGDAVNNTATACGDDPLEVQVCGTDDHHLVVIHPSIQIVKSAPGSATAGTVITYTFTVTNLGDTALSNVLVTDDKLGAVGTIDSLAPGQTSVLTKQFTVPAGVSAVDNIGTACGTDSLSKQVCDTDTHHLTTTQVLGEEISRELPRTGTNSRGPLLFGGFMVLAGCLLRSVRRRKTA